MQEKNEEVCPKSREDDPSHGPARRPEVGLRGIREMVHSHDLAPRRAVQGCLRRPVRPPRPHRVLPGHALPQQVGGWDVAPTEGGKERARASPLRYSADDLVVGLDPDNENRILLFDSDPGRASLPLPTSFFVSHRKIDVRTDMLDTGIDICSPDVLARFSDEFDYRDIRKQFVHNSVAEEEEGLQNRIHAHILGPSEYAARVHDPRTYAAVSSDLLRRWCYPVVPDNLPSAYEKRYRYVLQRHHLYREAKGGRSRIGRSSSVIGPGMVGSRCHIGEGCNIKVSCFFAKCVPLNGARCVNMHSSLEAIPHLLPFTLSYIICTLTNNDIIAHRHWQPLRH